MRGSIRSRRLSARYKRRQVWDVIVDVPSPDGRRKRKWYRGLPTRKAAEDKLTEVLKEVEQGTYVAPSVKTVGEFLEEWIEAVRTRLRPSAWDSYRSEIRKHIVPGLGSIRLQRLSSAQLNRFYAKEMEERSGAATLSRRTIRYHHTIIRKALADAVRWHLVARNVAEAADPPKHRTPDFETWTASELRAFLDYVKEDPLYPAWHLTATTGMRRGEILGLPWPDVDLDGARLSVRQTLVSIRYELQFSEPKTAKGKRQVTLDAATVTALREHRKRQIEARLAKGRTHGDQGLVFIREDGAPIHPDWFSKRFKRLTKRAGLRVIRFQDLRHTYATLALAAGVHPKIVSERLGHASVTVTLDTYSHVVPTMQKEAADTVAELILGFPPRG